MPATSTTTSVPAWTIESVTAWRLAALADGWAERPTYQTESIDRAARLQRDGWEVSILARPADGMSRAQANVAAWGPDTLCVIPPVLYSWPELQKGLFVCSECGAIGPTVRLHFATRVCPPCRARLAPEREKGNWTE